IRTLPRSRPRSSHGPWCCSNAAADRGLVLAGTRAARGPASPRPGRGTGGTPPEQPTEKANNVVNARVQERSGALVPDQFVRAEYIDHVALNVTDLDRSAKWYKQVLGLDVLNKWDNAWLLCRGKIRLGIYICQDGQPVPDPDKRLVMRHYAFALSAED